MGRAASAGPWAEFEHAGIAKMKAEPGQDVYTLTPGADRRMAQGGRAARGKAGPRASRKPASIRIAAMKELRADLAKNNALAK